MASLKGMPSATVTSVSGNSAPVSGELYRHLASVHGAVSRVASITEASANPTTADIAPGDGSLWKNTTSGQLRLWANDGGTLKSVLLS
jgi:hypothetical protein